MKALPEELELGLGCKKNAEAILEMKVNHGDIVIIHGRELQDIYEHDLKSQGKLRLALTCRNIELGSLKVKPDYEVKEGGSAA